VAQQAMHAAGAQTLTDVFRGHGLHTALFVLPVSLAITAVGLFAASRTVLKDHRAMTGR
jgi:hypothetical protein